jgi:hypothetical protein
VPILADVERQKAVLVFEQNERLLRGAQVEVLVCLRADVVLVEAIKGHGAGRVKLAKSDARFKQAPGSLAQPALGDQFGIQSSRKVIKGNPAVKIDAGIQGGCRCKRGVGGKILVPDKEINGVAAKAPGRTKTKKGKGLSMCPACLRGRRGTRGTPVGGDEAIEPPFVAENVL